MVKQVSSFWRTVLRGTCPKCGKGHVYKGFFRLKPQCPQCYLDLRGHDMGDGPVYIILSILCFFVPLMALFVEFSYNPPVWLHLFLWPFLVVVMITFLLRPVKSAYLHQQYVHRSLKQD